MESPARDLKTTLSLILFLVSAVKLPQQLSLRVDQIHNMTYKNISVRYIL